jgi:hypothetical protein
LQVIREKNEWQWWAEGPIKDVRQNAKFRSSLNDITLVQTCREKYSCFYFSEIVII